MAITLPGYEVTVSRGSLARVGDVVRRVAPKRRCAILTDSNVGPLYARAAAASLDASVDVLSVKAGEEQKTREEWTRLTDQLIALGFGRDSILIALGGGVVGDLTGFVAATYMRGIPYVQVPTSLLAMIDASIGGKTGVDTPAGKNLVGVFHRPAAVIVDPETLQTLPKRQLSAGMAEAIKHGVIADEEYFETIVSGLPGLLERPHGEEMRGVIERSIEIKASVVRRDERETGLRKILNFGHTLGHAIEAASGFRMLHGEAVAIGMVLESDLAERAGIARAGTARRISDAVVRAGLPTTLPAGHDPSTIIRIVYADKKARSGMPEFALPATVGSMAGEDSQWAIRVPESHWLSATDGGRGMRDEEEPKRKERADN